MFLRSFGYPLAAVVLLLGALPAAWIIHKRQGDPGRAALFHRYLQGQGSAVRLLGTVRGQTITSASGRPCLAYHYWVQRSTGQSARTICSGGKRAELELAVLPESNGPISVDEVASLSIPTTTYLPLELNGNLVREAPGEALLRSCPGGSGKDRLVETCLLPGEEVEVWACRGPDDTLVACGDEAEMLQSPPAGGGLEKLRRESHSALAFALAWLCAWGLGALALLARSVPRVTAGESGEVTR